MISPSLSNLVATSVPIIQGFLSSLAVMAACDSIHHASVTNAAHFSTNGKYSGLVIPVTRMSHSLNSPGLNGSGTILHLPCTFPGYATNHCIASLVCTDCTIASSIDETTSPQ